MLLCELPIVPNLRPGGVEGLRTDCECGGCFKKHTASLQSWPSHMSGGSVAAITLSAFFTTCCRYFLSFSVQLAKHSTAVGQDALSCGFTEVNQNVKS